MKQIKAYTGCRRYPMFIAWVQKNIPTAKRSNIFLVSGLIPEHLNSICIHDILSCIGKQRVQAFGINAFFACSAVKQIVKDQLVILFVIKLFSQEIKIRNIFSLNFFDLLSNTIENQDARVLVEDK